MRTLCLVPNDLSLYNQRLKRYEKLLRFMATDSALADKLKQSHIKYWNDILNHKFILAMADNSLSMDRFAFYLRQDHMFLDQFCSFLLAAAQKSTSNELSAWFESLYHSTADFEMQMQKELLSGMPGTGSNAPAAATSSYIEFLRKISSSSLEVMVSSMAPCPWSYFEIAQKLSKENVETGAYRMWIQFYASGESARQVDELRNILGRLYGRADKDKKLLMKKYFAEACRHEYEFWEMAYQMK